ncbi:MAG: ARMT1-like domain-containing protein [Actinobacteria bacterium]|nr:ARMT1-like domain-containing protein [Actinomycetota bacterium]
MKIFLDCVPCFIRQSMEAARLATDDHELRRAIVKRVCAEASQLTFQESGPRIVKMVHDIIKEMSSVADPYKQVKEECNKFMAEVMPDLRRIVENSKDPFLTAAKLAVASNVIDVGQKRHLNKKFVLDEFNKGLENGFAIDNIGELKKDVAGASRILYLGDNVGETFLDRLFIEQMPYEKVTYTVKPSPIINDALMEDARIAGITDMVRVIETGINAPGCLLGDCSEEFLKEFESSDLIIAKGHGNYESLYGTNDRTYFLLMAKCPPIAKHVGCHVGDIVAVKGKTQ